MKLSLCNKTFDIDSIKENYNKKSDGNTIKSVFVVINNPSIDTEDITDVLDTNNFTGTFSIITDNGEFKYKDYPIVSVSRNINDNENNISIVFDHDNYR